MQDFLENDLVIRGNDIYTAESNWGYNNSIDKSNDYIKNIKIDRSRDALLTPFGKATLKERYLLPGEEYQDLFVRNALAYGDNLAHSQRIYDYMSQLWFMPATPALSNAGTNRGLPISCFLNECDDSLKSIKALWGENVELASKGGGIGRYWGNVRSIGEKVKQNGETSGIIPFIHVMDSLTLAISQGSLRRGAAAVYLPVHHPEIEEFIEIRRPTGGDPNRKALSLHNGIVITDEFMEAVLADQEFELKSPKDGTVIRKIMARALWIRILTARIETGEPYLLFIDHVNKALPEMQKKLNLKVKLSNLCTEITLPTGKDHLGNDRTAVCCLSSLNLEYWDKWSKEPLFISDIMSFLDNVLQTFINNAPPEMEKAVYSAKRERSVGLGVMGFHSFLQEKNIPFESAMAKSWNIKFFKHIQKEVNKASKVLATERGACPDAIDAGIMERFSNKTSIAPTASISIIAGNSSPGIEPISGNLFVQKTLAGSFVVKNRHLEVLLEKYGKNNEDVWNTITTSKGSVQHLDFLTDNEKDVFKTAFELDQRWIIEHSADRTPYIDQSQSVNLFLNANIHKRDLHNIHMTAWKRGLKSLYYCRSLSIQRADNISTKMETNYLDLNQISGPKAEKETHNKIDYEECLACQ
jgi:ribonucleoside-diphosphate reductase alpha chain